LGASYFAPAFLPAYFASVYTRWWPLIPHIARFVASWTLESANYVRMSIMVFLWLSLLELERTTLNQMRLAHFHRQPSQETGLDSNPAEKDCTCQPFDGIGSASKSHIGRSRRLEFILRSWSTGSRLPGRGEDALSPPSFYTFTQRTICLSYLTQRSWICEDGSFKGCFSRCADSETPFRETSLRWV